MKFKFLLLVLLFSFISHSQTVKTKNLTLKYKDITLYLTKDTCSQISKHVLTYANFLKLDKERDDNWFEDVYKTKYKKDFYYKTGYDIGHLTPSHITSYNDTINHYSFNLFNASPQLPSFNRGSWKSLEGSVEDSISKYEKDVVIITGVIYDSTGVKFLPNSKIPIPLYYFKVLYIDKKKYVWLGSNINGQIKLITLKDLNGYFSKYKQNVKIT